MARLASKLPHHIIQAVARFASNLLHLTVQLVARVTFKGWLLLAVIIVLAFYQ